jgi:hypothetical protein
MHKSPLNYPGVVLRAGMLQYPFENKFILNEGYKDQIDGEINLISTH